METSICFQSLGLIRSCFYRCILKFFALKIFHLGAGHLVYSLNIFSKFIEGNRKVTTDLKSQITNLCRIGIALTSERNIDVLLEMIVDESRRLTGADAGTLFIVSDDGKYLEWKIAQTQSLEIRVGGTSSIEMDESIFSPVALFSEGQVNLSNVSAYAAYTGQTVNIPDVYEAEEFDFSGPRRNDAAMGYRSKSMLVVPLRNHQDDNIGVLMLLNAQDPESENVIPFPSEFEELITSLASQAAVAITNANLIQDLQNLFDAFIQTTATAIDEKSEYTAGHIQRVADLTMRIAKEINRSETGIWKNVKFTSDELNELRIAAWMHDVGKITTPEYVVDKATKLEAIYDRIETIKARYEIFKRDIQIVALNQKLEVLLSGMESPNTFVGVDKILQENLKELEDEINFIVRCNKGGEFMEDKDIQRLEEIASRTSELGIKKLPRLTENEVYNLSIRKGTLTEEERQVINNHASVSIKMLSQLPFSKKLRNVSEYAGGHHEKLSGKGYPKGLSAKELSLQARVMAVADIFEALTAPDRPYRKPMSLSQALKILRIMVKDGELDRRIVDLFIQSGVVLQYAVAELLPNQLDIEDGRAC